jgi:signal transduction histidine kinase
MRAARFDAQRRFVSNASHELRTPLTRERALVDVTLADPRASVASLRTMAERVRVAVDEQERLIDGLLTLARGERGIERFEAVDLAR